MTEQQLDPQGEAHEALGSVANDYGQRVLSDPRMIGNLVTDLLPDLPRERSLLVTGAEADIAGELTQHVQEQHLDPNTAVQLVARSLVDRRSLDPAASMWVTSEYAQALGYPVQSSQAPPPGPGGLNPPPVVGPAPPQTVTSYAPYAAPNQPTNPPPADQTFIPRGGGYGGSQPPPGGGYGGVPAGGGGYGAPQPPPGGGYGGVPAGGGYGGSQPPAGAGYGGPQPPAPGGYGGFPSPAGGGVGTPTPTPPLWGPGGGGQPPTRRRGNKGLLYGGGAAAVVVILVVALLAGGVFNSPKPKPTPTPTFSSHSASPKPSPTPTSTGTGLASLTSLLPQDIADPATQCKAQSPPFNWTMPGLVQALTCTDPGLPSGYVYAYQVKTAADYQTTWANYLKWWGFDTSTASSNCPPGNSTSAQGTTAWHDNFFPDRAGQVLDCEWVGTGSTLNEPAYTWTFPTENAFIVGQGAANSTFSALDTWWTNNASPLSSPTPAPASS
jgi:hypothetical protein